MLDEFKKFLLQTNAFALAVGVIIGAAVGKVVTSIVSDLLMPVIGGLGTLSGPVIGAAVYSIVQEEMVVHFPQFHLLLYGALLILIMLFEPGGLAGLWRRLARVLRGPDAAGTGGGIAAQRQPAGGG